MAPHTGLRAPLLKEQLQRGRYKIHRSKESADDEKDENQEVDQFCYTISKTLGMLMIAGFCCTIYGAIEEEEEKKTKRVVKK